MLRYRADCDWMVDFFSGLCHCTKYAGATSELMGISASIILGSAIGPVTYIVNAADLKTVTDGNQMHKYADDIILPATNSHTRETELKNVEQWDVEQLLTIQSETQPSKITGNNLQKKIADAKSTPICHRLYRKSLARQQSKCSASQ